MSDAGEPSARRTPRFEARVNARKKADQQKNSIGLSTVQGAVSGLKDYAAVHALKEGAPRCSRHCPSESLRCAPSHNDPRPHPCCVPFVVQIAFGTRLWQWS